MKITIIVVYFQDIFGTIDYLMSNILFVCYDERQNTFLFTNHVVFSNLSLFIYKGSSKHKYIVVYNASVFL